MARRSASGVEGTSDSESPSSSSTTMPPTKRGANAHWQKGLLLLPPPLLMRGARPHSMRRHHATSIDHDRIYPTPDVWHPIRKMGSCNHVALRIPFSSLLVSVMADPFLWTQCPGWKCLATGKTLERSCVLMFPIRSAVMQTKLFRQMLMLC